MTRIKNHYKNQAKTWGSSKQSTMPDVFVRDKEVEKLITIISASKKYITGKANVLEVGCGNGYTAEQIVKSLDLNLTGIDFCEDFISLAKKRDFGRAIFSVGNVLELNFENNSFDIVFTERCLINLESWEDQMRGINEIHRVLKPGGFFIMLEAFKDGLNNLNAARKVLGLEEIPEPFHNIYFDKEKILDFMNSNFVRISEKNSDFSLCVEENFLSSYYFGSRVLYPALVENKKEIVYNNKFIEFFSFMHPYGNYSYVQLLVFNKRKESI
jgi:ubiquinone/menaquinone biosynthesis C-methylase UbiE